MIQPPMPPPNQPSLRWAAVAAPGRCVVRGRWSSCAAPARSWLGEVGVAGTVCGAHAAAAEAAAAAGLGGIDGYHREETVSRLAKRAVSRKLRTRTLWSPFMNI